eukprot:5710620-Pyramimonas_sp.AAC.1
MFFDLNLPVQSVDDARGLNHIERLGMALRLVGTCFVRSQDACSRVYASDVLSFDFDSVFGASPRAFTLFLLQTGYDVVATNLVLEGTPTDKDMCKLVPVDLQSVLKTVPSAAEAVQLNQRNEFQLMEYKRGRNLEKWLRKESTIFVLPTLRTTTLSQLLAHVCGTDSITVWCVRRLVEQRLLKGSGQKDILKQLTRITVVLEESTQGSQLVPPTPHLSLFHVRPSSASRTIAPFPHRC